MKQKELLFLLVSVTIIASLWIVFSVVHQALSSTISDSTNQDITPIKGSFDLKTLQALKKRSQVLPQTGIAISPTPTPTSVPIAPVTPVQFFSIPVASGGGKTQ